MLLDASDSQLVLVDYQERLMPAIFEGPAALANALRLAQIAQLMEVPVWGTEQNPSRLGGNDPALRALCQTTLAKMHFSAAEEGPGEWLRPPAKPQQGGNARTVPQAAPQFTSPVAPATPSPQWVERVLGHTPAHCPSAKSYKLMNI